MWGRGASGWGRRRIAENPSARNAEHHIRRKYRENTRSIIRCDDFCTKSFFFFVSLRFVLCLNTCLRLWVKCEYKKVFFCNVISVQTNSSKWNVTNVTQFMPFLQSIQKSQKFLCCNDDLRHCSVCFSFVRPCHCFCWAKRLFLFSIHLIPLSCALFRKNDRSSNKYIRTDYAVQWVLCEKCCNYIFIISQHSESSFTFVQAIWFFWTHFV